MSTPRRFGRVSARPSEYLIKLHRGKVVAHGPGLSVRLWPGQTCTILPTSIQRTSFVADQVTAEKVGVAVSGIAVFRIAEPMVSFRMLDFSSKNATEQLCVILKEMFIGAARRLVANMSVEECLIRRKESIALELMREIQPVVSGSGRPDDTTDRGWGVVIDTIEIQDVRILSEKVFSDLQAPFRSHLELLARKSTVERDQELHLREVAARRETLEVDRQLGERQREVEEQGQMQALARKERVGAAAARLARQEAEQRAEVERLSLEQKLDLGQLEEGIARRQVSIDRLRGEAKAWLDQRLREVDNVFSDERLRYEFLTTTLPALAEAFVRSLGEVHMTRFVTDRQPGEPGLLVEAVGQLLSVARAGGLDLGQILRRAPNEPDF